MTLSLYQSLEKINLRNILFFFSQRCRSMPNTLLNLTFKVGDPNSEA